MDCVSSLHCIPKAQEQRDLSGRKLGVTQPRTKSRKVVISSQGGEDPTFSGGWGVEGKKCSQNMEDTYSSVKEGD